MSQLDLALAKARQAAKLCDEVIAHLETLRNAALPDPVKEAKAAALKADLETLKRVEKPAEGEKPAMRWSARLRLLEALATYGALTRAQVYFYTGLSMTSGPMSKLYAELRSTEVIDDTNNGGVVLIDRIVEQSHKKPCADSYELFRAFAERVGGNGQKILEAHYKHRRKVVGRDDLCSMAGVSLTSGPTSKAFARLASLGVLTSSRGTVTFSDWYLRAIEPTVRVFDTSNGETRRHDSITGMPL